VRRSGLLGALLTTLLLTFLMPGLWRSFFTGDHNRMDESLRPPQTRTLTLWITGRDAYDEKLLSRLLSAYEKANPGLRIYLRRADAADLLAETAVLPDGVFYGVGDIPLPEECLQPLSLPASKTNESFSAGKSCGVLYGVPLWYAPGVISLPMEWIYEEGGVTKNGGESFFGKSTPPPPEDISLAKAENLPWDQLLVPAQIYLRPGVCLMQALHYCPEARREELAALWDSPCVASVPNIARFWSYPQHLAASRKEALLALPLTPGVSDQVRFFSLCRENADAMGLLTFLQSPGHSTALEESGFLPVLATGESQDGFLAEYLRQNPGTVFFPNAFAHTAEELDSLCSDAFRRREDPVTALLRLR